MDTVLDSDRLGALVRNYTAVTGLSRQRGDSWAVRLTDAADGGEACAVHARVVINTAGMWIDCVNQMVNPAARRRITGTKGAHIMVRLPPECREFGINTEYRDGNPFYIYPWRGMHYVGPTDTLFTADEDDLRATEEEIEFLLSEANHLLPGLGLTRSDVLFSWAGVRPQTHDATVETGQRGRVVHDLTDDGMPNMFALSAGNIITHRRSGTELCAAVTARITPSGKAREPSYAARSFPEAAASPALVNHWSGATLADLRHAAEHEYPVSLADLLFRRVGAGWTETMAREGAHGAAAAAADILGWDGARIEREVSEYHELIARLHGVSTGDSKNHEGDD